MNKNRRFILATLLSGTVFAAAGAVAGPFAVFDATVSGDAASGILTHLVDWDEEDDDGSRKDKRGDDDDHEDDDDDDDDDDDGRSGRSQPSPAPVGTVAPPSNGLILEGSTPKVQVN
ncbi:MAG: hypothetical protein K0M55_15445 [Rhizobium sp.]|nr:hypothetical protein [Rhizobium sp.]MBW8319154.1 hypothetical protein [Rhizobium sp.]MBW8445265.1 hypothetical protein [Arenimonas sp.]